MKIYNEVYEKSYNEVYEKIAAKFRNAEEQLLNRVGRPLIAYVLDSLRVHVNAIVWDAIKDAALVSSKLEDQRERHAEELGRFQQCNRNQREAIETLSDELAATKQRADALKADVATLERDKARLAAQLITANDTIDIFRNRNAELKKEIERTSDSATILTSYQALKKWLSRAQAERDEARRLLTIARQTNGELVQKIEELEKKAPPPPPDDDYVKLSDAHDRLLRDNREIYQKWITCLKVIRILHADLATSRQGKERMRRCYARAMEHARLVKRDLVNQLADLKDRLKRLSE